MPAASVFTLPHSPIAAVGTATLIVAFVVNAYAFAAALVGQRRGRSRLVESAVLASYGFAALMCLASSLMIYAFLSHDFTIRYVAHYSDTSMPFFYKITSYWGGLDGSLMYWVWILSVFAAVAVRVNHRRHRDIIGYVVATIAAIAAFFVALLLYSKNPFSTFLTTPPVDGKGLNPLLQNYWMVIHPPALYTGFVSMAIPFAFCIAALAAGRLDDAWLHSVRVWVIVSWFFLTLGLVLGMIWAYEELGWGGYWAWDPVENAGLLPWFTATAFLHSIMIQERRGMLKVWNVVLMIVSFFLTIFGTFMTRSGVVQSVHAFGQDNQLAMLFILFMLVILVVSFGLVLYRLPALRSSHAIESYASREFVFLLNNWILLAAAFFVLFATMFPTLSESIMGQRITVGPPFFNKWMVPLGLVLLFLTAVGPLLAWRETTRGKLFAQFRGPVAMMVAAIVAIAVFMPRWRAPSAFLSDKLQLPVSLLCFGLTAFTLSTVLQELLRGARVRRQQTGTDPVTSLIGIVLTKRRKYGGYLVHSGMALMFLGFAGNALNEEKQVTLDKIGQTFQAGGLTFRYDDFAVSGNDNRTMFTATVSVLSGGKVATTLTPARWQYLKGDQQMTTEVALDRRLDRDIYLVMNGFSEETKLANFTLYLKPLVNWVWLGFGLLALGSGICLLPESLVMALRPRRRTSLGRAAEAAAIIAVVVGCVAFLGRMARADEPVAQPGAAPISRHVEATSTDVDPAKLPPLAVRLMKDLVCLCGDCQRLSLYDCRCGFAAKERENVLGMLTGRDLSTPAAADAAYDEITRAYIARFGGQHVLTVPIDKGFNRLAWAVPYAAVLCALVTLVFFARRWVRRGRAETAHAAADAPVMPAALEAHVDQLDDELDQLD